MGKVSTVIVLTLSPQGDSIASFRSSFRITSCYLGLAHLQVYKTLSDSVILDWYISLYDKDRMSSCTVVYSPKIISRFNATGGISEKEKDEDDTVALNFLPRRRTFLLQSLSPNTTYKFVMECADSAGRSYATKSITFKTGAVKTKGRIMEVV